MMSDTFDLHRIKLAVVPGHFGLTTVQQQYFVIWTEDCCWGSSSISPLLGVNYGSIKEICVAEAFHLTIILVGRTPQEYSSTRFIHKSRESPYACKIRSKAVAVLLTVNTLMNIHIEHSLCCLKVCLNGESY